MKTFRKILPFLLGIGLLHSCSSPSSQPVGNQEKVVIAYVTSWSKIVPNPALITHINYAFGHVNDSFDGVRINNEERLRQMVALKEKAPHLKVLLSIGGWGSGRFSEMAENEAYRLAFAADCQRVVQEYQLDGIDLDWEYPTCDAAGISASPQDTDNFTLLMRDIRLAIGKDKLLTMASVASAKFVDFRAILKDVDFVNIMSYDMNNAPLHHASLYRASISGDLTCDEAVQAHIDSGVPAEKLVLGMPFYGRGGKLLSNKNYRDIKAGSEYTEVWNDTAKVPYLINQEGVMVLGFDNPKSLAIKCEYVHEKNLLGGMYWDYAGDNDQEELARTVYEGIMK